MRARYGLAVGTLALCVGAGLAASLPSLEGRPDSTVLTDTRTTQLGRAIAARLAAHPGKSGTYALRLVRFGQLGH